MNELKYFITLKYQSDLNGWYIAFCDPPVGCCGDPFAFAWKVFLQFKKRFPEKKNYHFIIDKIDEK